MAGRAEMVAFVEGRYCRRITMDQYMDGNEERRCCGEKEEEGEGEQLCDICEKSSEARERAEAEEARAREEGQREEEELKEAVREGEWRSEQQRKISRARRAQKVLETEELRRFLEEWNWKCAVCWMKGRDKSGCRHPTKYCNEWEEAGEEVKEAIRKFRGLFRVEDYGGCRRCGLPQEICERWEEGEQGWVMKKKEKCQFEYVLIDVVVTGMVLNIEDVGGQVVGKIKEDGVEGMDEKEVCGWFGKKQQWGGFQETNRLTEVFFHIARWFDRD